MGRLQRVWIENKRFLLLVCSALAAFLLLERIVHAWIGSPDAIHERIQRDKGRVQKLAASLRASSQAERDADALRALEAATLQKLALPPPGDVPEPGRFTTAFLARRDRIYSQVQAEARKRNIGLPPRSKIAFAVSAGDPPERLARRWIHLGVVERVLKEAVRIGFRRVSDIEPLETTFRAIPSGGGRGILFFPVRVGLVGDFDAFVKLFDAAQTPGAFLQLRVESLGPAESGGLAGRILAAGLELAEAPPSRAPRKPVGPVYGGGRR